MRIRYTLLFAIIIILLLPAFLRWLFAPLVAMRFAQLVDYLGLPSTLYMPNVSCPGCNQFSVPYLIKPQQTAHCSDDNPIFLMVLVVSKSDNYDRRLAIRRSWGSVSAHREMTIRTYFVCGRTSNSTIQGILENEAKQWHDIVQVQ